MTAAENQEVPPMRVMICGHGNADTEAGVPPTADALAKMLQYNEQLTDAGLVLDGAGLMPTSVAKRVRFDGTARTVIDGPFAEAKELIAGYWIWQVRNMEEAVQWLKRGPFDGGVEVTIRQVFTWRPPGDGEPTSIRVMVYVPGNQHSESGTMAKAELIEKMMEFNEALVKAGVYLDGAGLAPTSNAKRVRFDGAERTVIDGPFTESKELIAGYMVWQVESMAEAVEWVKRSPLDTGETTIRPIFETEDFIAKLEPELRVREEALVAEIERQKQE